VHRPVHREGRKFFPKNFFALRGELGREEVQGIIPGILELAAKFSVFGVLLFLNLAANSGISRYSKKRKIALFSS